MTQYDLMIIGGGMVGAALAYALKSSPFRIALVDASPTPSPPDHRLIGLNYGSFCFFKKLALWEKLAPFATPIEQIHVSKRGHFGISRIYAAEQSLSALGYVVPASVINQVLYAALAETPAIDLLKPATLKSLTENTDDVTVTLNYKDQSKTYSVQKILGVDGSFSTVRTEIGIDCEIIDYQQSALVTETLLQRDHHNIAYERFQENGAIAMLPLPNQRAATIWTAANAEIDALLKMDDTVFLTHLQQQFGYRLGRFLQTTQRAVYPLKMLAAKQQTTQHVLLLGNAVHTLHPIAAQGLNLALYEIALLAEHLVQQTHLTNTWQSLPDFSARQQFSKQLSHRLAWLFSHDFFILNAARQMGMIGFDLCTLAKQTFARQAIGIRPIPAD